MRSKLLLKLAALAGIVFLIGDWLSRALKRRWAFMAEVQQFRRVQHLRRSRVDSFCLAHGNSTDYLRPRYEGKRPGVHAEFSLIEKYSLAWCKAGKVGTTTWTNLFLQMYKKDPDRIPPQIDRHMLLDYVEKRRTIIQAKLRYIHYLKRGRSKGRFTSFMGFRHPVDRLYSAFRGKIVPGYRLVPGVNLDPGGHQIPKPRFSDFLRYVSSPNVPFNPHWTPVSVICDPCKYNFTFYLAIDDFTRETVGLLRELNLQDVVEYREYNVKPDTITQRERSDGLYEELLQDLDSTSLRSLLDVYAYDFILFGYDMQPFLRLLKQKESSERLQKNLITRQLNQSHRDERKDVW